MKALTLWLGEENVVKYQIVVDDKDLHSDHALIRVGEYFLDGDGVSTYKSLFNRWYRYEYLLKDVPIIRPFDFINEPLSRSGDRPYYINDASIKRLVNLLDNQFFKDNLLDLMTERNFMRNAS